MKWLLCLICCAGCGEKLVDACSGVNGACIDLQIDGSGAVKKIDRASIHLSGLGLDGQKDAALAKGGAVSLPVAAGLVLDSLGVSGTVNIDVTGFLAGDEVGAGHASVTVAPQRHVRVHVTLASGGGEDLAPGGDLGGDLANGGGGSDGGDGGACGGGTHLCGINCVSNTDPATCHDACTPCTAPANASATCDGTTCDFSCNGGFVRMGTSCVACGAEGQPCCASSTCDAKFVCQTNLCQQKFLSWSTAPPNSGTVNSLGGIWIGASGAKYVTQQGDVLFSSDGNSWSPQPNPLQPSPAPMFGIWGSDTRSRVWAGGNSGGAIEFSLGSWKDITGSSTVTDTLTSIWGDANGLVYFTTSGTEIAVYDSTQGSWSQVTPTPAPDFTNGIWGSAGATPDIYAVGTMGSSGAIAHSKGGAVWTTTPVGTDGLQAIWGTAAGDLYAVGQNAAIYHTTVGSDTWTKQTATEASGEALFGVWGSDTSGYVYAVGGSAELVLHTIGDGTWKKETTPATSGIGLYGVYGNPAGTEVYAVGDSGVILRGQ